MPTHAAVVSIKPVDFYNLALSNVPVAAISGAIDAIGAWTPADLATLIGGGPMPARMQVDGTVLIREALPTAATLSHLAALTKIYPSLQDLWLAQGVSPAALSAGAFAGDLVGMLKRGATAGLASRALPADFTLQANLVAWMAFRLSQDSSASLDLVSTEAATHAEVGAQNARKLHYLLTNCQGNNRVVPRAQTMVAGTPGMTARTVNANHPEPSYSAMVFKTPAEAKNLDEMRTATMIFPGATYVGAMAPGAAGASDYAVSCTVDAPAIGFGALDEAREFSLTFAGLMNQVD